MLVPTDAKPIVRRRLLVSLGGGSAVRSAVGAAGGGSATATAVGSAGGSATGAFGGGGAATGAGGCEPGRTGTSVVITLSGCCGDSWKSSAAESYPFW